jgi:hypothetical protein
MDKKKNYHARMGMMAGTVIGGIAALVYVFAMNPVFIALAGIGAAFGLISGAGKDRKLAKKTGTGAK